MYLTFVGSKLRHFRIRIRWLICSVSCWQDYSLKRREHTWQHVPSTRRCGKPLLVSRSWRQVAMTKHFVWAGEFLWKSSILLLLSVTVTCYAVTCRLVCIDLIHLCNRAIFVWPWNENARTNQKKQANGNRVIWLVYRMDTNILPSPIHPFSFWSLNFHTWFVEIWFLLSSLIVVS